MNLVSGLPNLMDSHLGEFYHKNKRDNVLTTMPCLDIHAYPQREKTESSAYVRTPRAKSEAEARTLMEEAASRANSVSLQRTTSLTHVELKHGRKETHHELHRWWTEPERA